MLVVDANAPLLECLAAEPHWPVMGRPGHLSVQESGTVSSQETQTLRQCLGVWDSLGLELRDTNAKTMGLQTGGGPKVLDKRKRYRYLVHQNRGSLNEAVNEYY